MQVIRDGSRIVYVYSEAAQPHHLPHRHVRRPDCETVVGLPTLSVLAGPALQRAERQLLLDNLEEICDCWSELNSEVIIRS